MPRGHDSQHHLSTPELAPLGLVDEIFKEKKASNVLCKFLLVGLPQALLVRSELYATHPLYPEQSMTRDVMEAARFSAENYADDRMPCINFYI